MSEKECCIYVIAAVKDGEIASPVLVHYLTLPNKSIAREMERMFHGIQSKSRTHGEWFDMHPLKALQILCLYLHLSLRQFTELDEEEIETVMDMAGVNDACKLWATQ
jgi:hypothetical protein